MKKLFIQTYQERLNRTSLEAEFGDHSENPNHTILDQGLLTVDFKAFVSATLDEVQKSNHSEFHLSEQVLEEIKHNIVHEAVLLFSEETVSKIGSRIAVQVMLKGFSKAAVIHFSSDVLLNGVRGGIISALSIPLSGKRLPPETLWTDLIKKSPAFMLNPEWAQAAHLIPDHPWVAHCSAIERRTTKMEQGLYRLIAQEEENFKKRITYSFEKQKTAINSKNSIQRYDVSDGTRFPIHSVSSLALAEYAIPFWAKTPGLSD